MNFLLPDISTTQDLTVTPREHENTGYIVTLFSELSKQQTSVSVSGTLNGSFLTLQVILNLNASRVYWFKVYTRDTQGEPEYEIYRGKLIALNSADPLKYSIYK